MVTFCFDNQFRTTCEKTICKGGPQQNLKTNMPAVPREKKLFVQENAGTTVFFPNHGSQQQNIAKYVRFVMLVSFMILYVTGYALSRFLTGVSPKTRSGGRGRNEKKENLAGCRLSKRHQDTEFQRSVQFGHQTTSIKCLVLHQFV